MHKPITTICAEADAAAPVAAEVAQGGTLLAVEGLARYAPDRSGLNMEQCSDGMYVLLSDVQDAAYAAQPPADAAPVDAKPFAYFVQPSSFGPFIECESSQVGAFPAYRAAQRAASQDSERDAPPPREPTKAMLTAARDWSVAKMGRGVGNGPATECWQAMYDAAMAAQQGEKGGNRDAALREAVGKLIKAKGRFHTEQNYAAVVSAYDAAMASMAGKEP